VRTRLKTQNDNVWTTAPSPVPLSLSHIAVPHLHTYPHRHGHYYRYTYNAALQWGTQGVDLKRGLRVRVCQICDVLLTNASFVSASGSGVTSVTATTAAAHTPSRRHSRIEVGAGAGTTDMGLDVDTNEGDETEAKVDGLPQFPRALVSRVPASVAAASHSAIGCARDGLGLESLDESLPLQET